MRPGITHGAGRGNSSTTLLFVSVAFALAMGAILGVVGFRTSNFVLTLAPSQTLPIAGAFFACYFVFGLLTLLVTLPVRRGADAHLRTRRVVIHGLTALTLWAALTLMFMPLKGSEAFVKADTLTTFQLNLIGLGVVLVAGWLVGWVVARIVSALINALSRRFSAGGLTVVGALCAVLAVAVLLGGSALRVRGRTTSSAEGGAAGGDAPRVAILAVDGCDWEKLGPLVESGRLPNFRRLMDEGSYGPLMSLPPLVSPRIWTTIATGKVAEKHGIFDFVNANGVPVNATMRTALPVWDIVSRHGQRVGVVGWYVTWPVEDVNGFLLSDRVHSLLRGPVQMVQSATGSPTNERLERFGEFEFDPGYKGYPETELRYQQNRIVDEPLRWGYLRDAIYTKLSDLLLPVYEPGFSAVYLRGVDFVQHFFWKYADPEPFGDVTQQEEELYGGVIDNYYEYTDRLLGRLLADLGDDVNVILVSDHGFQARLDPDPRRPQLTGTHDIAGVFIASGPAFRNAGRYEGATILDITPTVLAVMGLPVGDDMDGRPLTQIIEDEHLARHPVTTVASHEQAGGRPEVEAGSEMDESIRQQLRSLGYIE